MIINNNDNKIIMNSDIDIINSTPLMSQRLFKIIFNFVWSSVEIFVDE